MKRSEFVALFETVYPQLMTMEGEHVQDAVHTVCCDVLAAARYRQMDRSKKQLLIWFTTEIKRELRRLHYQERKQYGARRVREGD